MLRLPCFALPVWKRVFAWAMHVLRRYKQYARIKGMLSSVSEELPDVPL
jgi:hypothetical protein